MQLRGLPSLFNRRSNLSERSHTRAGVLHRSIVAMSAAANNDSQNAGPIIKLLVFSVIIVVFPLGLFHASQGGDFDWLYHIFLTQIDPNKRLLLSGAVAVVGVNLVVIIYILLAFLEADPKAQDPLTAAKERLLAEKQ